jgi:hypothetical protein
MLAATLLLALVTGGGTPAPVALPDGGTPGPDAGPPAHTNAVQDKGPVLVDKPTPIKPGDTTEVHGGQAPSIDPRLQGRAALPSSIQDEPLLVPNAPKKPPPGKENSPGTGF